MTSAAAKIGCVVSYCSLERHFLKHTLRECSKFASHIVVSYADKLYDLTPDNQHNDQLVRIKEDFPHVTFVQYTIDKIDELIDAPELNNRAVYWHNRARWEGLRVLNPECQYVMFMDADEVPEGDRVKNFLKGTQAPDPLTPAVKFANWWYMREPTLRFRGIEDSVVMVPRTRVATRDSVVLCESERNNLADAPVVRNVSDGGSSPMFHHFSWVRTPEDLVRKVQLWGHRNDRDWETAVRTELARPIQPGHVDVIFGRMYDIVDNKFGITVN